MRRAIDTAPRDGKFILLEDDTSGSFELAQWSAEARAWVGENGELSKITPTYWHPRRDDDFLQKGDEFILQKESGPAASREPRSFLFHSGHAAPRRPVAADAGMALRQVAKLDAVTIARLEAQAAQGKSERGPPAWRWLAVSSVAAAMVIGLYFRAELAAYLTRYSGERDNASIGIAGAEVVKPETQVQSQDSQQDDSMARDLALHQQADRPSSQAPRDTVQVKQSPEAMRPEAQQPLEKERRRAEGQANELARAQPVIATAVVPASKPRDQAAQPSPPAESATAELRQNCRRNTTGPRPPLAPELAKARRDNETQLALPTKMSDQGEATPAGRRGRRRRRCDGL